MSKDAIEKKWTDFAKAKLLGRRIVGVRYMEPEELKVTGFIKRPLVMQLDNGDICWLACDDEQNDGGVMVIQNKYKMEVFPTL